MEEVQGNAESARPVLGLTFTVRVSVDEEEITDLIALGRKVRDALDGPNANIEALVPDLPTALYEIGYLAAAGITAEWCEKTGHWIEMVEWDTQPIYGDDV